VSAAAQPGIGQRIVGWLAGLEDGAIIRAAFFGMLAGTAAVLFIDFRELSEGDLSASPLPSLPVLPAFDPDSSAGPAGPNVTTDRDLLRQPLTVTLGAGGALELTGTIDVGSADRFKTEIEAHKEYIKTVVLNSPGGSVSDALAIGALVREAGFGTSIAAGALCASSCPLVFAGGKERLASRAAAIGVHQIYAAVTPDALPTGLKAAGAAMSDAQRTTATISRHLSTLGVDPALWLHALETPPDKLYYLSADELMALKLATRLTD
jgi:hypothetical protein